MKIQLKYILAAFVLFTFLSATGQEGDFPEVLDLSDGGLFALRLDEVVPPTVPPLEEIEDEVADAWRATAMRTALVERAER